MPQRTVTLIRHGQRLPEGDDQPLTQLGRQQAIMTANVFKDLEIETIYFSTMQRARETAEIIARQIPSASLIGSESLCECIPTIPPQFRNLFQEQAHENPDYRSSNVRNAQLRLEKIYAKIFTPATSQDIHDLVICHGNVLRYLICRALNIDPHSWIQLHPPANCSLSQILIAPNSLQEVRNAGVILTTLYTFNETWHLPPEMHTLS